MSFFQGSQHFVKKKCPDFTLIFTLVLKLHEKYFPFIQRLLGRGGSSTANCYCLERCVIFTLTSHHSQSDNGHVQLLDTWHKTHIHQTGENLSSCGLAWRKPLYTTVNWCAVSPDHVQMCANTTIQCVLIPARVRVSPDHVQMCANTTIHRAIFSPILILKRIYICCQTYCDAFLVASDYHFAQTVVYNVVPLVRDIWQGYFYQGGQMNFDNPKRSKIRVRYEYPSSSGGS